MRALILTETSTIYSVALSLVRVVLTVVVRGLLSALEPAFCSLFTAIDGKLLVLLSDAGKVDFFLGTLSGDIPRRQVHRPYRETNGVFCPDTST